MNREDVIQLAREAGFVVDEDSKRYQSNCISHTWYLIDEGLERFANAIERSVEQRTLNAALERAAQECDERANAPYPQTRNGLGFSFSQQWDSARNAEKGCAAAIRALSDRMTVITVPIKHKD